MTKSALRMVAAAAIAALIATTLMAAPPAASSQSEEPVARANYRVPKVGECHLRTLKEASGAASARGEVPCTERHTLMTIAVKRLTGKVNWEDQSALYRKIEKKCWNALANHLGGSDLVRAQTAYTWFWFRPSNRQRAHGAKWLRCDIALYGQNRLMPLPTEVALTSAELPDRIRQCLTPEGTLTVCARPHAFRSVGAFRITGGYPSADRARSLALRKCDRFVSTRGSAWTFPSRGEWAAGYRSMVCYDVTRR